MTSKGFSNRDKEKLLASYQLPEGDLSAKTLNENAHEYVFYESKEAQIKRFEVLCRVATKTKRSLSGASILDVGCGIGDLVEYIGQTNKDFSYLGVDISASYIAGAEKKFPDHAFAELDILSDKVDRYDYVFACGIFNDEVTDNEMHLRTMVARMCDIAKLGVAFNFLTEQSRLSYFLERLKHKISPNRNIVYDTPEDVDEGELYFYHKKQILSFCQQLDNVQSVCTVSNYIPGDATILITKNA